LAVIPVLMYHHINPNKGDMITVTPSDFEGHLRSISEGGYRTLTLDELLGFMTGSMRIRGRAVVITFDDAFLDNFVYAFPLLRAYGARAAVFTPTAWLDGASSAPLGEAGLSAFRKKAPTHSEAKALIQEGRFSEAIMDWDMAREMHGSGLVEFASHTATHAECDALGPGDLARELRASKERLEEVFGAPCHHLCWPRGRYSEAALAGALAAGYRACFTTERGVVTEGSDPLRVERIVTKEGAGWVGKRLAIYTSPLLSRAYLAMRGRRG